MHAHTRILRAVTLSVFVSMLLAVLSTGIAQAVETRTDNTSCSQLNKGWSELKLQNPATGTYSQGALSVTLTRTGEGSISWTSNIGLDAVFVKGGSGGNLYSYDPEASSGSGTTPTNPSNGKPYGLSHVSFCYDVESSPAQEDQKTDDDTKPAEKKTPQPAPTQKEKDTVDASRPSGNLSCKGINASWLELKLQNPATGSYGDGVLQLSVTRTGEGSISWTSNIGLDAVFVKGGNGGNLYRYDPEATSGSGSTPTNPSNGKPYGLSHVSFCYDSEAIAPKEDTKITPTTPSGPRQTQVLGVQLARPGTPSGTAVLGANFTREPATLGQQLALTGIESTEAVAWAVLFILMGTLTLTVEQRFRRALQLRSTKS